jgi:polysaccharide export outer membrane protein
VKFRSLILIVVFLASAAALGAQAQPVPPPPAEAPAAQAPADGPVESFYKLQASDVLYVKYLYTPEYDATVTVRPDGFITLPLVGEVKVSGLTISDARREIVRVATVRLHDPDITVELKDFQKPRFVVGGHVEKPGQFELRGRMTLLEAVAMAGGFKTSAKHSQVILFRRYDETRAVTRVIDAKELTRPNKIVEDPTLRAGDMIFVPQNRISKVERLIPFTTVGWLLGAFIQ